VPTPTPTPTFTPTPTPAPTLQDFGIVLEGNWTTAEQTGILTAATEAGKALSSHGAAATPVEAFREVLQGRNGTQWRQIRFSRIDVAGTYCTTIKNPSADFSANIQCDIDLIMTQYTAVHEFGHVFVGRTTVSGVSRYLSITENPGGANVPLRDSASKFVMGYRGYVLAIGTRTDWQRSDVITDNGWGSAALWDQISYYTYNFPNPPAPTPTPLPLSVPRIGPCGPGAPAGLPVINQNPYPFQQNPCTFPNWETTDPAGAITEIEEAAADMFLNWVYRKNSSAPPGFIDNLWRSSTCYPNGCADSGLSGQARTTWMNQKMTDLFTEFGW
jgi:hypothetical protein